MFLCRRHWPILAYSLSFRDIETPSYLNVSLAPFPGDVSTVSWTLPIDLLVSQSPHHSPQQNTLLSRMHHSSISIFFFLLANLMKDFSWDLRILACISLFHMGFFSLYDLVVLECSLLYICWISIGSFFFSFFLFWFPFHDLSIF